MASLKVGSLGEYIREQRTHAEYSLRQLAEATGISNPYLSQIERGLRRPSADILQQIAKGLRISAETLYVRAGILEEREGDFSVETAILGDAAISERQKRVLLEIYASFQAENGSPPNGTPARRSTSRGDTKAPAKAAGAKAAGVKAAGRTAGKAGSSKPSSSKAGSSKAAGAKAVGTSAGAKASKAPAKPAAKRTATTAAARPATAKATTPRKPARTSSAGAPTDPRTAT